MKTIKCRNVNINIGLGVSMFCALKLATRIVNCFLVQTDFPGLKKNPLRQQGVWWVRN